MKIPTLPPGLRRSLLHSQKSCKLFGGYQGKALAFRSGKETVGEKMGIRRSKKCDLKVTRDSQDSWRVTDFLGTGNGGVISYLLLHNTSSLNLVASNNKNHLFGSSARLGASHPPWR